MQDEYTPQEQAMLLRIAREALETATAGLPLSLPDLETLPPALRAERACFVTLHTTDGALRGCTGVLVARQPLAHEVARTAVQTAFNDPRFPALQHSELPRTLIELSLLTPPEPLPFTRSDDLLHLLRPHVDGVIMSIGARRATFLPQVWERVSEPEDFLALLCQKMGLPPGAWRRGGVQVFTYHTVVIEEERPTTA
ncbi:MAG: AmmeMemoRadiSam system protein A [Anaerolineae bacterium]|nr:AmmeMemoRadiSam system protein A [Anaerolineae bacterium]